jgi:hypothetical protein
MTGLLRTELLCTQLLGNAACTRLLDSM